MIELRPVTPSEAKHCEAILRSAFGVYVQKLGRSQSENAYDWLPDAIAEQRVLCGHLGGRIVGVAIFNDDSLSRTIEQIAVAPEQQGRGIGSVLLNHLQKDAVAAGFKTLHLDTAEMMTDLLRLYERHGFRIIRRGPPTHGRDPHVRVFMEKSLAPA